MQNFIKTILSGVQTWTKRKIKESTADWNQNDPNADNYVKNRTHWEEGIIKTIALSGTYSGAWNWIQHDTSSLTSVWVEGSEILVNWNGIEYNLTVRWDSAMGYDGVGNFSCYNSEEEDTGEPFAIYICGFGNTEGCGFIIAVAGDDEVEATCEITVVVPVVHKLDTKYLPDNIATTDAVQSIVGSKMDTNNPVGSGSFSMNRKWGSTVGYNSHAEGSDTTASGSASHAEGHGTTASGEWSHAEGTYTVAQRKSQHAQGEYNILDTKGAAYERGMYAHIVGNGTSNSERSNAHTLDWNGIGWFQGGLQVGGNAQDDGAKNVLLEGDAVPVPESATVGQTIAVKSVDENGKPVEWECIDATDNGNFGYVVQDTAPEDISVLWVDTADDSDEGLQEVVNIVLAQAKESGVFDGDPGRTPEKGVDYYTEEDKIEMVNAVISALPTWTGGSY